MKKERIFFVFEYGERTDVLVGCYRNEEDAKRKHAEHPSSYYKVVVFIVPLQGLYAILLEILWVVASHPTTRWF